MRLDAGVVYQYVYASVQKLKTTVDLVADIRHVGDIPHEIPRMNLTNSGDCRAKLLFVSSCDDNFGTRFDAFLRDCESDTRTTARYHDMFVGQ